jgi:RNAse (barnase) inhibitor barstar
MTAEHAWHFDETPKSRTDGTTIVNVPASLERKEDLFNAYEVSLGLPDYFGGNWDAFEECIRDLSWVRSRSIVLSHNGLPFADNSSLLRTYISILAGATEKWSQQTEHDIEVHFPRECESAIKDILKWKRGRVLTF